MQEGSSETDLHESNNLRNLAAGLQCPSALSFGIRGCAGSQDFRELSMKGLTVDVILNVSSGNCTTLFKVTERCGITGKRVK